MRAVIAAQVLVLVAVLVVTHQVQRLRSEHDANQDLVRRHADAALQVSETLRSETRRERESLLASTEEKLGKLEQELRRETEATARLSLEESRRLWDNLIAREEHERADVIASVREDLRTFGDRMDRMLEDYRTAEDRFRSIQRDWDGSVFLVHSEFAYRCRESDGSWSRQTGTGWGTGFLISAEGHLVTNKHVAQPWKFDPELASLEAAGQLAILEESLKLYAWPAGTPCMDKSRKLLLDRAYNNTTQRNLRLEASAPDNLIRKYTDIRGIDVEYRVHDLDNNDLVLLKLEGSDLQPLPFARSRETPAVAKLDWVMALGFPRGYRGLESGIAETSPSLGTVRKVEDTIHITASIIPGNSGGPLFNENGQVVGIATRIYSETLGICLKIDHALDLLATIQPQEPPLAKLAETGDSGVESAKR